MSSSFSKLVVWRSIFAAISSHNAECSWEIVETFSIIDKTLSFSEEATVRFSIQLSISWIESLIDDFMFVKLLLVLRRVFCWLSIAELPACVALEVSRISDFISSNILVILSTDCFEFSASFLTSPATTEKPLPASPALAASIAAFKESKFVN